MHVASHDKKNMFVTHSHKHSQFAAFKQSNDVFDGADGYICKTTHPSEIINIFTYVNGLK